jgi:hypothetical protein
MTRVPEKNETRIVGKASWAALARSESKETAFPEGAKSVHEIREELKAAGLPYGRSGTHAWLKRLVDEGKARVFNGTVVNAGGNLVRATKYLIK